jgi:hypothetical protein
MGFLVTCTIPRTVKFDDRPQLDALIRELTPETFAVRYEPPPTADDISDLECLRGMGFPDHALAKHPASKDTKRAAFLII